MRINVMERKFSVVSSEGWWATALVKSWVEKEKQEFVVDSFQYGYIERQKYVRPPELLKTILLEEYKYKFCQTVGNNGGILDWGDYKVNG